MAHGGFEQSDGRGPRHLGAMEKRHAVTAALTTTCLICVALSPGPARADDNPGVETLDGVWAFTFGFGEIPFLAGSFKPSVSFGYHFNRFIYVGTIVQLSDVLERGDASFNAVNAGLDGLVDTRETTGPRVFLGTRLRPHRYSPYLSLGAIFNGTDIETIYYDNRTRNVGGETVNGTLEVEQARPFGIRPAFGLGYSYTFSNGLVLDVEFTGAWLFKPADPRDSGPLDIIAFEGSRGRHSRSVPIRVRRQLSQSLPPIQYLRRLRLVTKHRRGRAVALLETATKVSAVGKATYVAHLRHR